MKPLLLKRNPMRKAFTLTELVIVIAIVAILSAVILPTIINTADNSRENIVDIFNGNQVCCVYENNNLLFVGNIKDFDFTNYTMLSVDFKDGCVVVEVQENENGRIASTD